VEHLHDLKPGRLGPAVLLLVLGLIAAHLWSPSTPVLAQPLVAPTPGSGAMTIYRVANPNSVDVTVVHAYTGPSGFNYSFQSIIPAGLAVDYHVRDIAAIPQPFDGSVSIRSASPITAEIVGFDYPSSASPTATPAVTAVMSSTPTASSTPTRTPIATRTPTLTPAPTKTTTRTASPTATLRVSNTPTTTVAGTRTSTPTATPSASPTATQIPTSTPEPTGTAPATPTPSQSAYVLLESGFEETSFESGNWSPNVYGAGSTARLVNSPIFQGSQAARFSTATQSNGERSFAQHTVVWPTTDVLSASATIDADVSAVQFRAKILSLDTDGPNQWIPRAGFNLLANTFEISYTGRDNLTRTVDTNLTYQRGAWYSLRVVADFGGADPVYTYYIGDKLVYTVTDTSTGSSNDRPVLLTVGFGPGSWGVNAGAVTIDEVQVGNSAIADQPVGLGSFKTFLPMVVRLQP
jgi:hypothetical protein